MKSIWAFNRLLYSLLILIGGLFGAGCPPSTPEPSPAPVDTAQPVATTPPAPPVREDKSSLTLCQSMTEPPTLDPGNDFHALTYEIAQHIFDRLLKIDPAGRIVPGLATSWEYLNQQTLQLRLRRGVLFHNGETFNAAAVKFSLERLLISASMVRQMNFLKTVTQVRIVDNYTLQIRTAAPDGLLLRHLAIVAFIFPPRYYQDAGAPAFGRHPVGTGPFQFQRWDPNRQIILVRNPRYWVPGIPRLERLVFRFIPGTDLAGSPWLEPLFAGQLDFIKQLPGSRTFDVQSHAQTKLIKTRSARYAVLMPNPTKAPFSDIRLRQAMALAFDKDLLIRLVAHGNGQKVAFLSSDMEFGHNSDLKPYPYSPARARGLVSEAGYAEGLRIRALVYPGASPRVGHVLTRFLREVGIELSYDVLDGKQIRQANPVADYDLWIFITHNPFMHTAFLLNQFMMEMRILQADRAYPPAFPALYKRMISTLDLAEQARLCHELESMAYGTYFIIPLFQMVETYGVTKSLVYQPSVSGLIDLSEAYFQ